MTTDKSEVERLKGQRSQLLSQMESVLNYGAKAPLTAQQAKAFDDLDDKLRTIDRKIKVHEMDQYFDQPHVRDEFADDKNEGILKSLPTEQKRKVENFALMNYVRTGSVPRELRSVMSFSYERDDAVFIKAAVQSTTTTAGGYLIPQGFQAELEKAIKTWGGMWETSRIIKTEKGNSLPFPHINDTNHTGYIISESGDNTSDAEALVFGRDVFQGYKYTSGLIQVPNELLEDSELFAAEIIPVLAERIWRATNTDFSIGNGTGKPTGIAQTAVYAGSTANDTALAYDDFRELKHSVDPGYWKNWMFNSTVLNEIEGIKDSAGLPVFRGLDNKIILERPYVINNDLPSFANGSAAGNDNKKLIFFGDFSKYVIRMAKNMRIVRLSERYADLDQVAFMVLLRADGKLMDAGTHPVKYLRVSAS